MVTNKSNLKLMVHPLVILQISEQYSRHKVQRPDDEDKVFGIILGRVSGRTVEAINSFTIRTFVSEEKKMRIINIEHFNARLAQYIEVFPELQVIGVYCTGDTEVLLDEEREALIQLTVMADEKSIPLVSPVFLKLKTMDVKEFSRKLPLAAYECNCDAHEATPVEWILFSEESERIGVNDIKKFSTKEGDKKSSPAADQFNSYNSAVFMLYTHIEVCLAYFNDLEQGKVEFDREIVRESNLLADRLRLMVLSVEQNRRHFEQESREIAVFSLLPKMTNLLDVMNQVYTKLNQFRDTNAFMRGPWPAPTMRQTASSNRMEDNDFDEQQEDDEHLQGPKRKIHASEGRPADAIRQMMVQEMGSSRTFFRGNNTFAPEPMMPVSPAYVPDAPMPSASGSNEGS